MYISELKITNFRSFKKEIAIQFHEGANVIIGHNNAGKQLLSKP
ncbi:AAA family ATPase [Peribacillus sp. JNUCC 23]